MKTAQGKTRRVIVIATVATASMLMFSGSLQASEPCRPDGFCPLPGRAADQKQALRVASSRAALKNMLKKQAVQCGSVSSESLTARLNEEISGLQEQIVLKAKETGLLLQLPGIVMEFMKNRHIGSSWKQFCYGGEQHQSSQQVLYSTAPSVSSES